MLLMLPSWLPLGTFQHALPRSEHSPGTCQQALHGTLFAFYWKKSGHDRIATDTLDATLSAVSWNTSTRSVCQALDFSTQDATLAAPTRSSSYALGFRLDHSSTLLMLRSWLSSVACQHALDFTLLTPTRSCAALLAFSVNIPASS